MSTGLNGVGIQDVIEVLDLYTGGDIDVSVAGAGNASASVELTTIDSAKVLTKTYVLVNISFKAMSGHNVASDTYVRLKIEHKSVGGVYSTAFEDTVSRGNGSVAAVGAGHSATITIPFALTANEKNNGIVIKITASIESYAGITTSFNNIALWVCATR